MRQLAVLLALLLTLIPLPVAAQDGGDACPAMIQDAISAVLDRCGAIDGATACAAAGSVTFETPSGTVDDGTVALDDLTALNAEAADDAWSIARFDIPDPQIDGQSAVLIVLGPATLTFEDESDLPPGAAFTLASPDDPAPCDGMPVPGVLVQAPDKTLALLRVNGVDLAINGTALIQAPEGAGTTINAIMRETILGDTGVVVFAGYAVTVTDGAAGDVAPYDAASVAHLPTVILPRMDLVPVPGSAQVREETVLHLRPDASAYTGTKVKVGLPVTALGMDSSGEWLYIRTYDGATGWVPRAALDEDFTAEMPVFDQAPPPPTRPFGPVYARGATTSEVNNLRAGPGQDFDVVTQLPFDAELRIYGRNSQSDWLLVETEDGTRAWISATLVSASTPFLPGELPVAPDAAE